MFGMVGVEFKIVQNITRLYYNHMGFFYANNNQNFVFFVVVSFLEYCLFVSYLSNLVIITQVASTLWSIPHAFPY